MSSDSTLDPDEIALTLPAGPHPAPYTDRRVLRDGSPMYVRAGRGKMRCRLCDRVIRELVQARAAHEEGSQHRAALAEAAAEGACPRCGLPYTGEPCLCHDGPEDPNQ